MKSLILFITILATGFTTGLAQTQNILVEYAYKSNYVERVETLLANNTQAINIKEAISYTNENNIDWDESSNSIELRPKQVKMNAETFYLERDHNNIYISQTYNATPSIVKDVLADDYNWDLSYTDTKEIGGILCKKATTSFRGTQVEAWYAEEISISFGPNKFKGLPGLILELYSLDDPISMDHWVATKIVFPYKDKVDFSFDQDLPMLLYKDVLIEQEKKTLDIIRRSQTRAPKGMTTSAPNKMMRVGIEKVYEWEE